MKSQIFTFARKIITHSILTSYLLMSIGQSYAMDPQLGLDTNGFKYRITGVEIIGRGYDLEESHDDPEICQAKEFESISDRKTSEGIYSSLGATPTNGWESVGGLPNSRNPTPTHGLFKALEMTPPRKHSSDKSFRSKTP